MFSLYKTKSAVYLHSTVHFCSECTYKGWWRSWWRPECPVRVRRTEACPSWAAWTRHHVPASSQTPPGLPPAGDITINLNMTSREWHLVNHYGQSSNLFIEIVKEKQMVCVKHALSVTLQNSFLHFFTLIGEHGIVYLHSFYQVPEAKQSSYHNHQWQHKLISLHR